MKKFIITPILLALFTTCTTIMAQVQQEEYLGLPGDNLNLYAVMKLFQESETLEGFERNLNDENTKINNLDLNGDNYVDYIRVLDYVDGDVHNIVLQVPVNNKENQDVAVFTVQRYDNGQVLIQLTGDEALYGKNYIIEPIVDLANSGETPNPGYSGNSEIIYGRNVRVIRTTTYEIANWPLIRFIYLPTYVGWYSSWYWGYYPSYWSPWRPYYWHYYYGYHYNWYDNYYGHYRRWNYHRYPYWDNFYYASRRCYSPHVNIRMQAGHYKNTYSRPDQRRAGEAMYTKMYAEQNSRRTNISSGNNSTRRTATQSPASRQITTNTESRRTATSTNNRSVTNQQRVQNTGTARRTTTTATTTNRPVANAPSVQNSGTARRSTTTVTSRQAAPAAKAPAIQNAGTARRSTTTVTSRQAAPAAKVPAIQNAGTARRSTSTVASRPAAPAAKAPSIQNAGTARRSTATVASRPAAKAPARQSVAAPRSSTRSVSAGISSSSRRSSSSSGSSKSVSTAKKGGNIVASGSSRSAGRR